MPLPVVICLYFFHCSVSQYINHNLGSQTKHIDESFDISKNAYLSLSILKVLKEPLLLYH